MKKTIFISLLLVIGNLLFAQSSKAGKGENLSKLNKHSDIKITEVEPGILKLNLNNSKVIYKNINDYTPKTLNKIAYSPTFDTTVIDLTTIDTTLYYQMYDYWQEVPLGNFRILLAGDVNNNGLPELYGQMKNYTGPYTDITCFEMNSQERFDQVFSYDNTVEARTLYDIDKDGNEEIHLLTTLDSLYPGDSYRFYKKKTPSGFADSLNFVFYPFDTTHQENDNYFGDWDGDLLTDQIFINLSLPASVNIFEYNNLEQNFDSVYQFNYETLDLYYGGFSIGDFDMDGKTEFLAGSVHGKVLSIENCGDNCYAINWQGMVDTYNAYLCAQTNDIDGNGKKEIWIGGDAFYDGVGITRITLFEANGNNSYVVVGRIDLIGIVSFDAGNIQIIDVDKDGKEEVLLGLDQTVLILKFNGSQNHQSYKVFYYKRNDWENNNMGYYGATLYDLTGDNRDELLINMWDIIPNTGIKWFNWLYKPNFTVGINELPTNILESYDLLQNYPNPFNPSTNIRFKTINTSNVTIKIYNILGKEITTLLDKELTPGDYNINWDAKDCNQKLLPSGVYLIRLTAQNFVKTIRAVLLK